MIRFRKFAVFSALMCSSSVLCAQEKSPNQAPAGQKKPAVGAQVQTQVGQNQVTGGAGAQVQTFGGIGPTPWFGNPSIRQELKLNDEQFNRLNRDYKQNWDRYQTEQKSLGATLTPQQRQERMQELQGNFNQGFNRSTENVFTEPGQRDRFNQLHHQYQGYGSFNDPTVRERLKLTQEQQKRINVLDQNWQRDMQGMTRNFATDRDEGTRRYQEWSRKNRDGLKDILNEDQHRMWAETTGKPYDFSPDVYFPNEVDAKIKTPRSSDK